MWQRPLAWKISESSHVADQLDRPAASQPFYNLANRQMIGRVPIVPYLSSDRFIAQRVFASLFATSFPAWL
jgi:hypothetical protein